MEISESAVQLLLQRARRALAFDDWGSLLVYADTAVGLDRSNSEALALRGRARAHLQAAAADGPADSTNGQANTPSAAVLGSVLRPVGLTAQLAAANVCELVLLSRESITTLMEEGSPEALAELVASDSRVTRRLLLVASGLRRGPRPVETAADAIDILGTGQGRALALASVLADALDETTIVSHREFWRFALLTGTLADLLARQNGFEHELLFAAGVVHNIGLLGLDTLDPDGLREAHGAEAIAGRRLHDRERHVFGFTDAALGATMAAQWGFPEALVQVISSQQRDAVEIDDREQLALSSYVVQARIFARSQGLSDGLEASPPVDPRRPWNVPPVSTELSRRGGVPGLLKQYDRFLDAPAHEAIRLIA